MRLPAALVISVLIWSAARYLPPYYLELHKMDVEEEKVAVEHSKANALLRQMRLQIAQSRTAKPAVQHEEGRERPLY